MERSYPCHHSGVIAPALYAGHEHGVVPYLRSWYTSGARDGKPQAIATYWIVCVFQHFFFMLLFIQNFMLQFTFSPYPYTPFVISFYCVLYYTIYDVFSFHHHPTSFYLGVFHSKDQWRSGSSVASCTRSAAGGAAVMDSASQLYSLAGTVQNTTYTNKTE